MLFIIVVIVVARRRQNSVIIVIVVIVLVVILIAFFVVIVVLLVRYRKALASLIGSRLGKLRVLHKTSLNAPTYFAALQGAQPHFCQSSGSGPPLQTITTCHQCLLGVAHAASVAISPQKPFGRF